MTIKAIKFAAIFGLLTFLYSAPSYSQSDEEIKAMQQLAQAEVRLVFIRNLNLTEEEADAFWPIYDEYRSALGVVGIDMAALLHDYISNFQNMTDEKAGDLTGRFFEIQQATLNVKMEYAEKMAGVVPAITVAKFVQIENKLSAIGRYQLASQIPLIQE